MLRNSILSLIALISISTSVWSQKPSSNVKKTKASSAAISNAEKMGYARTNQYWGPGTYYSFAPGVTADKMVNNAESAMRDLTGISREDCLAEIKKQGFTEVPNKEMEKWFNSNKSKENFFYAPDKSYILSPNYVDLYMSTKNGFMPYACKSVQRYVLLPKEDSLKVLELVWQYLRDLHYMKLTLGTFGSTFKKAKTKVYPIEVAGSAGWSGLRAGSFVLRMVDGKPVGTWERTEDIMRRTIGHAEFELKALGSEADFAYDLRVRLQKEGYVLLYNVSAITLSTLEPGANWQDEHKRRVLEDKNGIAMYQQAIDLYKKSPNPPVLEDLNHALHIK